ncbi:hypothetical protein R1flu_006892 [Riccia fluitans]|uniref:Uncharacterized protein n=1 Tax=Riccia fluitans TaxID=41844 RepID=A0ABD1YXI2_9MARC
MLLVVSDLGIDRVGSRSRHSSAVQFLASHMLDLFWTCCLMKCLIIWVQLEFSPFRSRPTYRILRDLYAHSEQIRLQSMQRQLLCFSEGEALQR